MSLKDNYFRNASAKLLIFPLSCKFSRWNIVKINRKCGAIFFSLIYCHYCHSKYNCLIVINLSVAIRAFLIATYCHLLPR